jgi:hypothetical protein
MAFSIAPNEGSMGWQMEAQWQVNNSNIKNCLGNNLKFKIDRYTKSHIRINKKLTYNEIAL